VKRRVAVVLAVVVGVVVLGIPFTFKAYRIPTSAMEPTLRCARPQPGCTERRSDRVAALRFFADDPGRGEVIAFRLTDTAAMRCGAPPGSIFIKRVMGLPGALVELRDGLVYVNNRRVDEPYVDPRRRGAETANSLVPPGHYYVLGDNRVQSCDSRIWGVLPKNRIVAKLVFRYWPPTRIGFL
jgi:signal peptidase I